MASSKADNSVMYIGTPGFCHHTLTKEAFHTEIIDGNTGQVTGNYTKTRNTRDRSLVNRFTLYKGLPEVWLIVYALKAIVFCSLSSDKIRSVTYLMFADRLDSSKFPKELLNVRENMLSERQLRRIYLLKLLVH